MDSVQFNQLVQEVREALESGSQGVGEVERVTSLSGIVSLPALRLIGASESVVEAPLELLSAPAVEAAADSRKATEDATIAAVNASAAADLSEAERKDLADIKEQTLAAGNDSSAKGDKAFRGAMNAEGAALYAMQVASLLQGKLAQAQVVILSGKADREVIERLESQVQDSILICAGTREEAYSAILQLRELQIQVAQAIVDAYVQSDSMRLSTADARLATELANKAAARLCELSEQTERVIVESVIQTGEAGRAVIRLEDLAKDLLLSMSAADIAARQANEQADRAGHLNDESERLNADNVLLGDRLNGMVPELEKATEDAKFSAAGADAAAAHASEQSEAARMAAERSNLLSDNPPKIVDGVWWKYDENVKEYVSTGIRAKGDTGNSFKVIGSYGTLAELKAAVPDGSGVDGVYGVGSAPPYTYYSWSFLEGSWDWRSQGRLQGPSGESAYEAAVRLHGYDGTAEEYTGTPVRNAVLAKAAADKATEAAGYAEAAGGSAIGSAAGADIAAGQAREQADKAKLAGEESERLNADGVLLHDKLNGMVPVLEKAAGDATLSAAGADAAAGHASEQSEAARMAAERSNLLSDNPPKVVKGFWWKYDETVKEYVSTGVSAVGGGGGGVQPFSELDDVELMAEVITNAGSGWCSHTFPQAFSAVPVLTAVPLDETCVLNLKNITASGFQYRVLKYETFTQDVAAAPEIAADTPTVTLTIPSLADTSEKIRINYQAILL